MSQWNNLSTLDWLQARPVQWLATGAGAALVVALAYVLAQLFWMLWPPLLPVEAPLRAPSTEIGRPGEKGPSASDIVSDSHLFGKVQTNAPKPRPQVSKAPETRLRLTLKGVVAGDDPGEGGAIIADEKGDEVYYGIGTSLANGSASLKQVFTDYVVLERNHREETLRLVREGLGQAREPSQGALASNARARTRGPEPGTNPQASSVRELRDRMVENPKSLAEVVRVRELYRGGKLRGFRLLPGKNRKLFKELGLRSGDVLTAVNGTELNDPVQGVQILTQLKDMSSVRLDVIRRGKPTSLDISLQ